MPCRLPAPWLRQADADASFVLKFMPQALWQACSMAAPSRNQSAPRWPGKQLCMHLFGTYHGRCRSFHWNSVNVR